MYADLYSGIGLDALIMQQAAAAAGPSASAVKGRVAAVTTPRCLESGCCCGIFCVLRALQVAVYKVNS